MDPDIKLACQEHRSPDQSPPMLTQTYLWLQLKMFTVVGGVGETWSLTCSAFAPLELQVG